MNYAAIDIGSNAGRLLIGNVLGNNGTTAVKKVLLTRVPLRLGEDVFTVKKISPARIKMLIKTLKAYKLLMDVYGVHSYRACATSAMREAENSSQVIALIKRETGIKMEVITGQEEANLIFSTFDLQKLSANRSYLYIDVGGGSTEITLIENGVRKKSKSFKLGTLRILKSKVSESKWLQMLQWVEKLKTSGREIIAVGTGGNINRILKINADAKNNAISYAGVRRIQKYLKSISLEDRMKKLGLRPDRADVIIPAADIYQRIMKSAGVKKILVPKVGLSDGIIYDLARRKKKK